MVGIRIHGAADAVDHLQRVHGLTVDEALEVYVIEAVLCLQTLGHTLGNGLYDDNGSVEVGLLVHLPDDPVNECAEEVAFAKLYDSLRALCLGSGVGIQGLHKNTEIRILPRYGKPFREPNPSQQGLGRHWWV